VLLNDTLAPQVFCWLPPKQTPVNGYCNRSNTAWFHLNSSLGWGLVSFTKYIYCVHKMLRVDKIYILCAHKIVSNSHNFKQKSQNFSLSWQNHKTGHRMLIYILWTISWIWLSLCGHKAGLCSQNDTNYTK
jgi:hypothetical protein